MINYRDYTGIGGVLDAFTDPSHYFSIQERVKNSAKWNKSQEWVFCHSFAIFRNIFTSLPYTVFVPFMFYKIRLLSIKTQEKTLPTLLNQWVISEQAARGVLVAILCAIKWNI